MLLHFSLESMSAPGQSLGTPLEQDKLGLPSSSLPHLFSSLNLFDILFLFAHPELPGLKIPVKLSCNHKMQPHFCH